ncbi:MAG: hypothetical protein AAB920_01580 [Patescibacteria group bacterium]
MHYFTELFAWIIANPLFSEFVGTIIGINLALFTSSYFMDALHDEPLLWSTVRLIFCFVVTILLVATALTLLSLFLGSILLSL